MVSSLLRIEDSLLINPWYARVPSSSNPGDEPSRKGANRFSEILIDATRVDDAINTFFSELTQHGFDSLTCRVGLARVHTLLSTDQSRFRCFDRDIPLSKLAEEKGVTTASLWRCVFLFVQSQMRNVVS